MPGDGEGRDILICLNAITPGFIVPAPRQPPPRRAAPAPRSGGASRLCLGPVERSGAGGSHRCPEPAERTAPIAAPPLPPRSSAPSGPPRTVRGEGASRRRTRGEGMRDAGCGCKGADALRCEGLFRQGEQRAGCPGRRQRGSLRARAASCPQLSLSRAAAQVAPAYRDWKWGMHEAEEGQTEWVQTPQVWGVWVPARGCHGRAAGRHRWAGCGKRRTLYWREYWAMVCRSTSLPASFPRDRRLICL